MPSFGAITIEALQILESLSDDLSGNQTWGENVFHAIEAAYLDRREQKSLSDADRLTSKDWAKKRATEVHNEQVFWIGTHSRNPTQRPWGIQPISPLWIKMV